MVWFYARRLKRCSLSNRRGPFARSLERLFELARARAREFTLPFSPTDATDATIRYRYSYGRIGRVTREFRLAFTRKTRPVHSWSLLYSGKSMLFYNQRAMRLAISPSTRLNRIDAIGRELKGIRRIEKKSFRLENRTEKKRERERI